MNLYAPLFDVLLLLFRFPQCVYNNVHTDKRQRQTKLKRRRTKQNKNEKRKRLRNRKSKKKKTKRKTKKRQDKKKTRQKKNETTVSIFNSLLKMKNEKIFRKILWQEWIPKKIGFQQKKWLI